MKSRVERSAQPVLIILVGRQIVQNHMNLWVRRIIGHDLFHKVLEVFPLLGMGRLALKDAR